MRQGATGRQHFGLCSEQVPARKLRERTVTLRQLNGSSDWATLYILVACSLQAAARVLECRTSDYAQQAGLSLVRTGTVSKKNSQPQGLAIFLGSSDWDRTSDLRLMSPPL